MWLGPRTVNTVRSTFGSDNLDKSGGKIKGNSVRVVNNVVDRVRLAPELAGIVRTCPLICFILSCSHRDAGLCLE
jgi:hypothetical protein